MCKNNKNSVIAYTINIQSSYAYESLCSFKRYWEKTFLNNPNSHIVTS